MMTILFYTFLKGIAFSIGIGVGVGSVLLIARLLSRDDDDKEWCQRCGARCYCHEWSCNNRD